jgi:hypothetical protein
MYLKLHHSKLLEALQAIVVEWIEFQVQKALCETMNRLKIVHEWSWFLHRVPNVRPITDDRRGFVASNMNSAGKSKVLVGGNSVVYGVMTIGRDVLVHLLDSVSRPAKQTDAFRL